MATSVNRITVPRRYVSRTLGRHWMTVWKRSLGEDTFVRIDIDSGVVLETTPAYVFANHFSSRTVAPPAAVPLIERFGHSDSCPVLSVPPTIAVTSTASLCCCPCECGDHAGAPLPSAVGAYLPSVLEDWDRECDGGGAVPTASDPTDSESWVS